MRMRLLFAYWFFFLFSVVVVDGRFFARLLCVGIHVACRYHAPLQAHQTVQFRLAELQTEIEAFRALVYRCTEMFAEVSNLLKI